MTARSLLALLLVTTVLGACAVYKPARVLAPQQFGLTCVEPGLCLDDLAMLDEARVLRNEALSFVESRLGPFKEQPKVLFCSTTECFGKFGPPVIAAQNVGRFGAVINARGWQPYILRHEMIHHWQNEQFGLLEASLILPRWYIEGMAYVLSEDPRETIPNAEAQAYRDRFRDWLEAGNDWRVPPR